MKCCLSKVERIPWPDNISGQRAKGMMDEAEERNRHSVTDCSEFAPSQMNFIKTWNGK